MPFVQDSFTDSDATFLESHTGEAGATWTIHPTEAGSTLAIQSGRAHRRTSSPLYYASGAPATAEYDVEVDVHVLTDDGSGGVCGRLDTTAATYYSAQHRASDDKWLLRRVVAGAISNLATYTDVIGAGGSRAIKLEIRDAAKKLFVAGVERASSADNSITAAGRVGLIHAAAGSAAGGYHFDNLIATDAGGGGTDANLSAALTLGQISAAGTLQRLGALSGALTLGSLSLAAQIDRQAALSAALTLGQLAGAGSLFREAALSGSLTLGPFALAATIGTPSLNISGALVLPGLSLSGDLDRQAVLQAALTLGQLSASGTVSREAALQAALTLGQLQLSGVIGEQAVLATLEVALTDAMTLSLSLSDALTLSPTLADA